jgi:hypothetical protein
VRSSFRILRAALRWGRARERELYLHKPADVIIEAPTLAEFALRFLDGYAVANRQKPSGIAAKETILLKVCEDLTTLVSRRLLFQQPTDVGRGAVQFRALCLQ